MKLNSLILFYKYIEICFFFFFFFFFFLTQCINDLPKTNHFSNAKRHKIALNQINCKERIINHLYILRKISNKFNNKTLILIK